MDKITAHALRCATSDFYKKQYVSFSSSRQCGWEGFEELLPLFRQSCKQAKDMGSDLNIIDLACGNLRFEKYLLDKIPKLSTLSVAFHLIDNCDELFCEGTAKMKDVLEGKNDSSVVSLKFQSLDFISLLVEEDDLSEKIDAPMSDIAVAFGIMHHIPGYRARLAALRALINKVKPGGFIILTFWEFALDENMLIKARHQTKAGLDFLNISKDALDEGDFILSWKNDASSFRYAHSFTPKELDSYINQIADKAHLIQRFNADAGNEYLAFQKNSLIG